MYFRNANIATVFDWVGNKFPSHLHDLFAVCLWTASFCRNSILHGDGTASFACEHFEEI